MAAISDADRVKRLHEIEKCNQEGMTNNAISEKLGLPIPTVERCQRYLDDLGRSDITPEILSKKRSELYLELSEATQEAKSLFNRYKAPKECKYCDGTGIVSIKDEESVCMKCHGYGVLHNTKDAERFLRVWTEVIEKKAKLYGLDNVKNENNFQLNVDARSYIPDMNITGNLKVQTKALAEKLKEAHEDSLKQLHDATDD